MTALGDLELPQPWPRENRTDLTPAPPGRNRFPQSKHATRDLFKRYLTLGPVWSAVAWRRTIHSTSLLADIHSLARRKHFVDEPELHGFIGGEKIVAVESLLNRRIVLPGVLDVDLVQPTLH